MEPVTRNELFLAAAGGLAVQLPEPVTREEAFLKRIADHARVFYDEIVDVVHVEPTTGVFSLFDDEGGEITYEGKHEIIEGGIYTITYDGTPYILQLEPKAVTVEGEAAEIYGVGNAKIAADAYASLGVPSEAEDSGEPFLVMPHLGGLRPVKDWYIAAEDRNEHTISITGPARNLVQMPSKYVPFERIEKFWNSTAIAGQLCKMNLLGQTDKCADGDWFFGMVKEAYESEMENRFGLVQTAGYVTVPYTGSTPSCGYIKLTADGQGGVRLANTVAGETGREYLAIDVDSTSQTITFRL